MITLRGYQQDMIDRLRFQLSQHRRVLLQAPTGSGKTALAVHMMGNAAARGRSSFFLVHQNELLNQTSAALWNQRLAHGMICPSKTHGKMPVQVAMVQTLVRRLERCAPPDLIIIDECHRSVSETYMKILRNYPNAHVVGLTATPQRTDGRGLDEIYQSMVLGPEMQWMIQHGYLCDYQIKGPEIGVDISGVKNSGEDWDAGGLEERINKPTITGNAIAEYLRFARGRRCVTMCVNIRHARAVADAYNEAGIPASSIEGDMTSSERQKILDDFRDGRILVITNVQLLVEGVDIPSIEVVQWLRPTQSIIIWKQGNGRGFRPADGKPFLIILDHVKNWVRHGLPDDEPQWSLEAREKKKKKKKDEEEEAPIHTAQCDSCFHIFRRGPSICPACGEKIEELLIKLPEHVEGRLVEIDIQAAKRAARIERGMARSIPDMVRLAIKKNYNRPAEWAAIRFAGISKRPVTKDDFREARDVLAAIRMGALEVGEEGSII